MKVGEPHIAALATAAAACSRTTAEAVVLIFDVVAPTLMVEY